MNKRNMFAMIAAVMLTVSFVPAAMAQDGGAEDEAAESTEGAEDAERGPKQPEGGEGASDEAADGESATESEGGDAEDGAAEGSDEEGAADEGAAAEASGEKEEKGPKTGPGGKPLREDYPGTDESKQERMDTEKIEGLEFEEGETPEDVYDMRIRELETRVDDLKEKVFQSKSRIVLLKETVLSGNISGSRAIISHETQLGAAYDLVRVLYSLDGARVFNQTDKDGSLSDKKQFEIYNGSISPDNHKLSILLELKGSGFGVFSYMEGYKFRIKDSCQFKAQSGRNTLVEVELYDRGRGKYEYEERPAIRCTVSSVEYAEEDIASADTDTQESDSDPAEGEEEADEAEK